MNPKLEYMFIQKLAQLPFVDEIYLYGSRARADNRPRSDIDLAIVCPQAQSSDWLKIVAIIDDADTLLPIDVIRLDTLADSTFKNNINKDKILMYRKEVHHE